MKNELSKERLQALKQQFIDDGYNDMRDDEIMLAIDALLAAHEQEPVAWQYRVCAGKATGWSLWHNGKGEEYEKSYQVERRPLFAHPAPVPAVPMAVAGFDAATAIRACMEFPESMHDIVEECAQIAENIISTSHAAPVPAVPECFQRLLHHAEGMSMGIDWNNGTAAGHHREKMLEAVQDCCAMLNGGKS